MEQNRVETISRGSSFHGRNNTGDSLDHWSLPPLLSNYRSSHDASSRNYSEIALVNILPSYQMHQAMVDKPVVVEPQNSGPAPPYQSGTTGSNNGRNALSPNLNTISSPPFSEYLSPHASGHSTPELDVDIASLSSNSSTNEIPRESLPQKKILDVHHDLDVLPLHSYVKLSLHFTKTPDKIGERPNFLDIETKEFSPGDNIYGYLIAENTSGVEIPFNTFYVMLEGNIYNDSKNPVTRSFLQSIDFFASSSLIQENPNPRFDPIDNTHVDKFRVAKLLPGIRYKRYFRFRLPQYVLEPSHFGNRPSVMHQLPPTIDFSVPKTLSFLNYRVCYTVSAKFIAVDKATNKYVNLKDCIKFIRVIPKKTKMTDLEEQKLIQYLEVSKNNLLATLVGYVKDIRTIKLVNGKAPVEFIKGTDDDAISRVITNLEESVIRSGKPELLLPSFRVLDVDISKKNIVLIKTQGKFQIEIPTYTQHISYIPPKKYASKPPKKLELDSWILSLPIKLWFESGIDKSKYPEIIHIEGSLVTFSYSTNSKYFPLEINHSMIFNNETNESFKQIIYDPFRTLTKEIFQEIKQLESEEAIFFDPVIVHEAKSINNLRTKISVLDSTEVYIEGTGKMNSSVIPWKKEVIRGERGTKNVKEVMVRINIAKSVERRGMSKSTETPVYEKFCLVPDFQTSLTGRLYYLRLLLIILDGTNVVTRIPVKISKN